MSNDPNDRFMISDLSSKLSAYINGENSDQSSQTKDPADIEDVFASEIKSAETVKKQPGDELFTDLNQALDSYPNAKEEAVRKQKLAEEQRKRQRAEEARRQQLRAEQDRQRRLKEEQLRQQRLQQEEQLRQQRLMEEQLRQQRLQQEEQLRQQRLQQEEQLKQQRLMEEQLRQQKLRRERALARTLAESLYSFDLEQPFTSVRSGHSTHFAKLSPAVKSMPSEEALKRALAKLPKADKTSSAGPSYEVPRAENYPNVPKAENYHEVPKAEIFYDAPKQEPVYEAQKQEPVFEIPKQEPVYEVPQSSTFSEPPALETASSPSSDKSTYSSQPTGESRYAKSPDPTYRGYQEDHTGGSRIAVIIALLVALLAVAAIFIMIRRYSTNLTNLLSGTPSQGTSETVSKAESEAEEESKDTAHTDDSREADTRTDSGQAADSQATVSMAIQEEGEIYHSDSQTAETDEPGESIPEDPNDINYLASVNEKAAEDAIAELSDAAPRLYLSAYGIKIGVGDSFNALSYVERIEDDADDNYRLYRDISVDGLNEFDAKVPGTYELTYFCYDSAGNRSNRARLTVIVE